MIDNDIHIIEKYIDGELQGEALILFEKRLKTDESFAKEYNRRIKFAKLWVDADDYITTKAHISNVLNKSETNFFISNRYLIFSIAASIIILIGAYFFFVKDTGTIGNQFAVDNDSINKKENTIVFQYDEPDKFARLDSVVSNTKLVYPVNIEILNDSEPITFKWRYNSNRSDTLFVVNDSDSKILLKLRIKLSDTLYTIKYPQFETGKYIWYISNKTNYARFEIVGENKLYQAKQAPLKKQ